MDTEEDRMTKNDLIEFTLAKKVLDININVSDTFFQILVAFI